MSPVTHFLASWVIASFPQLARRDVALVSVAGVAPDVDGFGFLPELLTRNSAHPIDWFTSYHHVLAHNLPFAIVIAVGAFALARRRWLTAGLALLAVHLHFIMDLVGSRGPDGFNWSIPHLEPFSSKLQFAWSGQWALNSWPNMIITVGLLIFAGVRTIEIGRSPVEILSPAVDRQVVTALRQRFLPKAAA